ncbi:MAG: sigma-70 family RNA polymerase sigma factor [Defluviitaleaceae bacterium]|nr:sigma-70 family RNA polymerase sigma factor [Defluviitaleaceae bacterium]
MDDTRIINLFFDRDEAAIHETQKKYASYLLTVAQNILGKQDAEECVNDTYHKAWRIIPPNRPAFFKSFLAKITRNTALDRLRANNAKKRSDGNVDLLLSELSEIIPSTQNVHAAYENNLTAHEISDFLRGLDADARFIFMRRYWYADSIATIAKNYRVSESKVKSSLLRTRRKLKNHLTL